MALTLTLRERPAVPLEAEALTPDGVAPLRRAEIEALTVWEGNRRARVGDFFAVSGEVGDELRIEGDLGRVKFLGAGMESGRLTVAGSAGMHAGAGMRGGELVVEGDVGDFAGVGMCGGRLVVRGSAGDHLGAGGAIVAGSDPEAELEEMLLKARPLLETVGGTLEAGRGVAAAHR